MALMTPYEPLHFFLAPSYADLFLILTPYNPLEPPLNHCRFSGICVFCGTSPPMALMTPYQPLHFFLAPSYADLFQILTPYNPL